MIYISWVKNLKFLIWPSMIRSSSPHMWISNSSSNFGGQVNFSFQIVSSFNLTMWVQLEPSSVFWINCIWHMKYGALYNLSYSYTKQRYWKYWLDFTSSLCQSLKFWKFLGDIPLGVDPCNLHQMVYLLSIVPWNKNINDLVLPAFVWPTLTLIQYSS